MEDLKKITILYIDDDEDQSRLMQIKLASKGYHIDCAYSCEEARRKFFSTTYPAILIDYTLPDGDGIQLLKEFAKKNTHEAYIFLTGNSDEKIAIEALSNGASNYLVKEMSGKYFELLPIMIQQAIEKKNLFIKNEQLIALISQEVGHALHDIVNLITDLFQNTHEKNQSAVLLRIIESSKHLLERIKEIK